MKLSERLLPNKVYLMFFVVICAHEVCPRHGGDVAEMPIALALKSRTLFTISKPTRPLNWGNFLATYYVVFYGVSKT